MTNVPSIEVRALRDMRDQARPHTLLDVREPDEFACCALADSLHVPMQSVPAHLEHLPRDRPVVVMCHHGVRSLHVAAYLRQAGLDAWNLAGGIDAWAREVDPELPRY